MEERPDADHHADLCERYPNRAVQWRLRSGSLVLGRRPLLMGIVNVTPDSFSDGGAFFQTQHAIEHARHLVQQGAELIDVGGESTRPYSRSVAGDEQLRRVMPVLEALCGQIPVPVSIDTSNAAVAREAAAVGVEIINDVTGLTGDPDMIDVARDSGAAVCAMHMQGSPATMQDKPVYNGVVNDVLEFLRRRRDILTRAGIDATRICLDPGIGFGKTHQHNLELLAACGRFHQLGCPVLVGHSRKGFLAKVLRTKETDRTAGTIGVALALARQGVQIVRIHDVAPVREALLAFEAVGGVDGVASIIEDS